MDSHEHVLFREEQKFNQLWLWVLVLVPVSIAWYAAIEQLVFGSPFGGNPASDSSTFLSLVLFGILLPLFMSSLRLVTEVRGDGLYIRFRPFHGSYRKFPFDSILSCKVQTYRPVRDYGGWGIRYGIRGKAYNVSGSKGLMLEFVNGKKLLIGSQQAEEFAAAMPCSSEA
ncbi:DUF6141 family protein [Methanolobus chelungpuianus]|uniref:Uncharacterized protein n=1 Tax=Methanolobus chelungpuianus TaxID=502115 RepID=A0AAE3HBI4_9EURY|nr:DUF6141 family protein [Methanolobus chelungpuianus]MCQ6963084.1 hypothetical protein [Methanolobus chelungpuianus]